MSGLTYKCSLCLLKFESVHLAKDHTKICSLKQEVQAEQLLGASIKLEIKDEQFLYDTGAEDGGCLTEDIKTTPLSHGTVTVHDSSHQVETYINNIINTNTSDERKFSCPECGKRFFTKEYVSRHVTRIHVNGEMVACPECNKLIKNYSLQQHINLLHSGKVNMEQCDICGKNLKGNIEEHKNRVHFKKFSMFCEECGKGFYWKNELINHNMSKIHDEGEIFQYPCTENGCSRIFINYSCLVYHLKAEHLKEEFEKSCEQCGKTFLHPSAYKRHAKEHKTEPLTYPCDICNTNFTSKQSLIKHLCTHSGDRPFVCEVCGQSFRSRYYLNTHTVVHTKTRSFACVYCDKKYSQQSALNRHIRKCHSPASGSDKKLTFSRNLT